METTCGIIADLIPLYLDGVCGEESRALVEEHTARCPACQKLLEDMGGGPAEPAAESVLRQTARRVSRQAVLRAAGTAAILLYWLVWLWQDSLAGVGDYRYFSYSFHEVYSAGYLLVPLLTLVWLAVLLVRTLRRRTWRRNGAMLLVLAVLLAAQAGHVWSRSDLVHVSGLSQVVSIPDPYHIVIEGGEGQVTLDTVPQVTSLMQADGTVYLLSYERHRDSPGSGRLNFVHGVAEP